MLTSCSDCQALDWKLHKPLCQSFTSLPNRAPDQVRAVLFSQLKNVPEFVYLRTGYGDGRTQRSIKFQPYMPHTGYQAIGVTINQFQCRVTAREPSEVLKAAVTNPPDQSSESQPLLPENKALGRATRLGHAYARGTVIGVRQAKDVTSNIMVYKDVDMRDARNIVDRLGCKRLNMSTPTITVTRVLGTLVSCQADRYAGKRLFRSAVATTDHAIYDGGFGASIPNLLGIAIIAGHCNVKPENFLNEDDAHLYLIPDALTNQEMALLSIDVSSAFVLPQTTTDFPPRGSNESPAFQRSFAFGITGFGSPLRLWAPSMGTALFCRADGKPFPKEHAEALSEFILWEVMPKIQDAAGGLAPNAQVPVNKRREVLDFCTKQNFEDYFVKMKAKKISQGRSEWDGLPSPYDITLAHYGDLPMIEDTRFGFQEL